MSQVGHDIPYFAGARVQQGYGLGNLFSSIAKSVLLFVKKGAKTLGIQVLQSGVEFANSGLLSFLKFGFILSREGIQLRTTNFLRARIYIVLGRNQAQDLC